MKKLIICAICAFCGFTTASAQKFGHINTQEVIQAMPEFATARTEIEKLTQQYESDLKQMQDELQKKSDEFDKLPADTPEDIKLRKQKALQELYNNIQESFQANRQALAKAEQEKLQSIQTKVLDAIKAIGQEGGYVYIMETGAGIPFISTTLSTDVTAQVKAKLGLK